MENNELINHPAPDPAWGSAPSPTLGREQVIFPPWHSLLIALMMILLLVIGLMALKDIHLVNFMHFQIDVLADRASY
jgi:hypothetical protein